jgi:hypothetical protein
MLRLVAPQGAQGQDPPKRRKGAKPAALFLTPEEARHVRAALRNTARAYGGRDVLATAMGVSRGTIDGAAVSTRPLSGTFAIRLAQAAGVSVESILSGKLGDAGRCQACGHRAGDGRLAAVGGAR